MKRRFSTTLPSWLVDSRFDSGDVNAGFVRGTDEGGCPYTCAWLRLCATAEAAVPTWAL